MQMRRQHRTSLKSMAAVFDLQHGAYFAVIRAKGGALCTASASLPQYAIHASRQAAPTPGR